MCVKPETTSPPGITGGRDLSGCFLESYILYEMPMKISVAHALTS